MKCFSNLMEMGDRKKNLERKKYPKREKRINSARKEITWIFSIVHFVRPKTGETYLFWGECKIPNTNGTQKKSEISRGSWQQFQNMWELNCFLFLQIPHALRFLLRIVLKICISCVQFQFFSTHQKEQPQPTMNLW